MINGQPISFDESGCVTVVNRKSCGIFDNEYFKGITGWTYTGTATLESIDPVRFTITAGTAFEIYQSVRLEAGVAYKWRYMYTRNSGSWASKDEIQGTSFGIGTITLDEETTVSEVTGEQEFTPSTTATANLIFRFKGGSSTDVTIHYMILCRADDDFVDDLQNFCFQLPLKQKGNNLLTSSSIDIDNPNNAIDAGAKGVNVSGTCDTNDTNSIDASHNSLTIGEDGRYFLKYNITDLTIRYGRTSVDSPNGQLFLYYLDADGNEASSIITNTSKSGIINAGEWTISSATTLTANTIGIFTDDGTGTCYIDYDFDGLETDLFKMWVQEDVTLEDDQFYRLAFRLANTTGVRVKVFDSGGTKIFDADSNAILFDKIFNTGTLPLDKTITIRYEFDDFIDYSGGYFWRNMVTGAGLFKYCKWDVWSETTGESFIEYTTDTHDTTAETTGNSYHRNIKYCIDYSDYPEGTYQFRAIDSCDNSIFKISNTFTVCNGARKIKRFDWTPGDYKQVGLGALDYATYDYENFFYLKASIMDLNLEEERYSYRYSTGLHSSPFVHQEGAYLLQLWNMPEFLRRAVALMMHGVFYIDNVAYRKVKDENFTPQYGGNINSPMRIIVHKVGDFAQSSSSSNGGEAAAWGTWGTGGSLWGS